MKSLSTLTPLAGSALLTVALSCPALAADRPIYQALQEAVQAAQDTGKIDGSVQFFLAGASPRGAKVLRPGVVTNKKSNSFGRSDERACNWAAQSAIISLHQAAQKAGANAVINIVSYYRKQVYSNPSNYECHAGNVVAGVALRGDLATIK